MENLNMQEIQNPKHRRNSQKSLIAGLLIVVFGVLFMMHNMNLISPAIWRVIFSWPMLLVGLGLVNLADRKPGWGLILMAVGGAFLVNRYLHLPFNLFSFFWPVLIIIIGLVLILSNSRGGMIGRLRFRNDADKVSADVIEDASIFGGGERIYHTHNFKGGDIVAIFGGSKIDLTRCSLAPGENKLEIVAIFGGTTLIVPNDWKVSFEAVNIFGGFSDKRRNLNVDHTSSLVISGVAIFGGGELKSY
ncbi:MAG: DUF5668 domain-containing protein [Lentimicrobiaceae bacterium]|nr:DUF5668 domain-containing protein [Lentimicrobiaceae bacterium]